MSVKTKMKMAGWSLLGLCCMVLLVAAMKSKGTEACKDIAITIEGATEHVFVKKADVLNVLYENNIHAGENLNDIDIGKLEGQLEQNAWIQDAELFFDNKQVLHLKIFEREPIARVFTMQGGSFYIDSTALRLPVSENAVARLIVFTSFPSDKKVLSKPDSAVLTDVKKIALYIEKDSFLTAQTAQVNITQHGTYELIPVIGDQVIRIGNADSLDEKFTNLRAFYTQIWSKVGFEKYSVIDIQYHAQVVAVRRGQMNGAPDTTKAVMQLAQAEKKLTQVLRDTLYAAPMKQVSVDTVGAQTEKTVVGKKRSKTGATSHKEMGRKNSSGDKKPKAVMPGKVKG